MKYAITFGFMSAAMAAAAFVYPSVGALLAWTSISFAGVSIAYAGAGARALGKGRDGRISSLHRIVLLPYLAFSWTVWHLCRILGREPSFNRIDDKLTVGRRLLSSEIPDGFEHYVDLTAEFEDPAIIRDHPSYRCLPILDAGIPSPQDLCRTIEAVSEGSTYVHCAQGHGRTGVFALALLIHRGRITTTQEGLDVLKSMRPAINLNRTQQRFIENYLIWRRKPDSSGSPALS
ncbi:protein-tyrosine phosphatase family protein [Luteolibacter flavescens]|uniref:Protein-tyrosine phosphatase family protein n=1 Tax=Luteolibacter flavescens TaxID=1859460 RepID=A0ABT3FQ47_9BACT|nr:protein-tyrosine phosphatase family protein [Luteolibacter flavescens]MCW1885693.1 protein-tyrosine phosphatase family protein [Luteolibacter flavescens]